VAWEKAGYKLAALNKYRIAKFIHEDIFLIMRIEENPAGEWEIVRVVRFDLSYIGQFGHCQQNMG
jgi:hypothetical protein